MRTPVLLLICCFVTTLVRAQNPAPKVTVVPGTSVEFRGGKYFIKPLNDTTIVFNDLVFSKPSKARIYHSAIDHMPVMVPDTKELVPIPNLWKGEIKVPFTGNPPRIPNAAKPLGFTYRKK